MKKVFILVVAIAIIFSIVSCTKQERVRTFGGTMEIKIEPGQKLIMATWKECDLFYLTEPMEPDYQPKRKTFKESSSFGVIESTIVFVENR